MTPEANAGTDTTTLRVGLSTSPHHLDPRDAQDFVSALVVAQIYETPSAVPAAVFAEFVEACYRRDALRTGDLTLRGRRVTPANLSMPVAQIVGDHDTLVPPPSTLEFGTHVPGPVTTFESDVGHVGLAVSADTHADLWPRVAAWFD